MSKKAEGFAMEQEVLRQARETLERENVSIEVLRESYSGLCEEYEKLLDETKFLTKVSDKLEAKLSAANDKLADYNKELAKKWI